MAAGAVELVATAPRLATRFYHLTLFYAFISLLDDLYAVVAFKMRSLATSEVNM